MTSQWADAHAAATAAVAKQKWNKALRALAPWLRADEPALEGQDWANALTTLAAALHKFESAVKTAANSAAGQPDDRQALYELGHALVGARRPDLAVAPLSHAAVRNPHDAAVLAELVAALELQGRNREVVAALAGATELVQTDPLLSYLHAFNAFMVADLDTPRGLLPRLQAAAGDRFVFMAARIERMLARADAMQQLSRLDSEDLRGWHFVLTAGTLLRGQRYGKTWDTTIRVKDGAQRLAAVLAAWQITVPVVLFPPERNSEVTARVVGDTLGIKAQVWHGGDERGLVVCYDARSLIPELRDALVHHRPGQPLFMQAAEHTSEQRTASDLLTYLYAYNTSPWGPGLSPENQPIDTSKCPVEQLVQEVLDAPDDEAEQADRDDLVSFAESLRDLSADAAPGGLRVTGQREPLWVGSPVA
jgi:hypothetical protein